MSDQIERASGVVADADDVYTDIERALVARQPPVWWRPSDAGWAARVAVEALSANGYLVIEDGVTPGLYEEEEKP